MSVLDGILKNITGAPDDVANLASKVGIDPALAEKAIAVLGQTHQMDGDTVELASARTGLDTGVLSQIVAAVGGEGSLSEFARMVQEDPSSLVDLLDFDGDGSPMDDIAGLAKGLFGGKG
ncbi:hypothetical protein [Erythrobacter sp. HL-111]|uniref:hypothetical protein n=1 Tax=Erythrobacter sp. HL-111 TaxID=1798193 RepID=UPI0006DB52F5|nr:hypothetical protein [Erythrobacter sp. HL-111]KPP88800.1 MAG: hypothetical protein HLUCCO15_10930 [Erythrobacteraceae bacterium HL-111]SDR68543.1 hypothetical protein SAMN04515621_0064 [Erythrobacter sp. HL-111]